MSKEYKNPALTTDIVVFSVMENDLNVLLIKRKNEPFRDKWAIPGGFVDYDEEIYTAAKRELEEETNVKGINLEHLGTFGKVGRDPRGRTVSAVYFACVNPQKLDIKAQDDAKEAGWFSVKKLPELAFDHTEILSCALENLRIKIENTPIVSEFMPEEFSISELQKVYEIIFDRKLDHGRFKCEILKNNFLERSGGEPVHEKTGDHLYKFAENIKFSSRFY